MTDVGVQKEEAHTNELEEWLHHRGDGDANDDMHAPSHPEGAPSFGAHVV